MKRSLVAALAATAVSIAIAHAQTATQQVTLGATVAGYCAFDVGGATGTTRTATVPSGSIVAGRVVGGALTISGTDAAIACNQKVMVQMKSLNAGIKTTPPSTIANFTDKIHYTATAAANGVTETLSTQTATADTYTTGTTSTAGAFAGPLNLTITTVNTASPNFLYAGAYSDTMTVLLTPVP